jgi:hypothetical protein
MQINYLFIYIFKSIFLGKGNFSFSFLSSLTLFLYSSNPSEEFFKDSLLIILDFSKN